MQDTNSKILTFSAAMKPLAAALLRLDSRLAAQVEYLLRSEHGTPPKNVFERSNKPTLESLNLKLSTENNNAKKFSWPLTGQHLKTLFYMPIRAFRGPPSRLHPAVDKLCIFVSSGTTSGVEGKSQSGYSPDGLSWYRAASIATFFSALERCVPSQRDNLLSISAVSLIPKVAEWPDSSLAQMVAWLADIWSTHYADPEDSAKVRHSIAQASKAGAPIYVFGTAFHFVNLLESGATFSLPRGSLVIETGGTKGRSRSVTREELYQMISTGFGIEPSKIISEYGMCELASQAWDLCDSPTASPSSQDHQGGVQNFATHLSQRSFQFPWWVSAAVMTTPSQDLAHGKGALTIFDPLRIDIAPVAIQTEDLARLHDQKFQLCGRVPRSVLKGCSLRVADTAALETSSPNKTTSKASGKKASLDRAELEKHSKSAHQWVSRLLADDEALVRLTLELGSEQLAQETLSDLASGFPLDVTQFRDAATLSRPKTEISQNWLMIPPSSHSIAFIQPLAQAFALGLSVRIRMPAIHGLPPAKTFLGLAVDLAQKSGFDMVTLDSSWRLGREDLLDGENILVFGDDETCAFMNFFAPGRVSTFGNLVSLTLVREGIDDDNTSLTSIVRDQLSLAQRGCLSSRAIIAIGGDPTIIGQRLASAIPPDLFIHAPTTGEVVARSMEDVRLMQNGFTIVTPKNNSTAPKNIKTCTVTIAVKISRLETLAEDLTAGLGNLDLVIPVFVVPELTSEKDIIILASKVLPVKAVSVGAKLFSDLLVSRNNGDFPNDIQLVKHGTLGAPIFDGQHMGRKFFAT